MRHGTHAPRSLATLILLGLLATTVAAQEESLPPKAKLVRIEAMPSTIALQHVFDYRQVLLTGVLETGERLDVTRLARIEAPAIVTVSPRGLVRPAADGSGALKLTVADKSISIPVTVANQKQPREVSFIRDVMPLLAKLGCNSGTCHGGAKGKNGFQLSLRGYDPLYDHRSLTDDHGGRRFDRAAPDRSLMLLKATNEVPHVGGMVAQLGEPNYEILKAWIAAGVKLDAGTTRVQRIELTPTSTTLPLAGMKQQIAVIAHYADGSTRDVSAESFLESSNIEVATVDKQGLVTGVRRGETAILARYEGSYAAANLIIMGDRSGFAWQPTPTFNWIDELVYEKLQQLKIQPSGVCNDTEFLRRLHLDLTGLPPEPEAIRAFLADPRPGREKREAAIDKLVGSPDYVDHWTNKWADLLQVNGKFLGRQGAQTLRDYIRKDIAANKPYDKFVADIVTGSGSNVDSPAAAYWKTLRDPASAMENTTHLFLAVRFNCNKCHDHPFERWTQDNYYQMTAYFAQVSRREDPRYKGQKIGGSAVESAVPLVEIVEDAKSGDVKHERTGLVTPPSFPYTHKDVAPAAAPRRAQLAKWLTSKDNAYFAKSYVNRVWSYLLGVGLIEPVDDIRAGNPPTNPKLLERLTEEFTRSGFDTQQLIRTICRSRTYQHAVETNAWNKDDNNNYSHALARRLPAEVLYDAIHRATGSLSKLPGLPPGSRASLLLDGNVQVGGGFFELLGRPARESACECERSNAMMLGPVLTLVNGPVLNDALSDPNNRIAKVLAKEKDDTKVVDEIFLAILCRLPTAKERTESLKIIQDAGKDHAALQGEAGKRLAALKDYEKQLDARQTAWEESQRTSVQWHILTPDELTAKKAKLVKQADNSILATDKNEGPELFTIKARTDLKGVTAVRLEALTDPSLPAQGPGRAENGNFVLHEFKLTVAPANDAMKAKPAPFTKALASFSQATFEVQKAIDNNLATGWAISPQFGKPQVAVFELKDKIDLPGGAVLTFTLDQRFQDMKHQLGKFRLSLTTMPPPVPLQALPDNIAKILQTPAGQRSPQDADTLRSFYRSKDTELPRYQQAVAELQIPGDPRAVGVQDLAWALLNTPEFLFNH